jgi:CheY-like chemotaxis protein
MTEVAPLILVVDDDPSVRTGLGRLIEAAGYAVETFESAHAFLDRAPHAGPCCLVLDVRMPGLTGLQLQEALAATGRQMAIVFVSGWRRSHERRAMKAGASIFSPDIRRRRAPGAISGRGEDRDQGGNSSRRSGSASMLTPARPRSSPSW